MKRLKVKIKEELIEHCKLQNILYDIGKRHDYNGNDEQQLSGMIGQSVIMDFFGLGYFDGSSGPDNGVDLTYKGKTYDVKTMKRHVDVKDHYANNFYKVQENYNVDGYIFCSRNIKTEELTVCGWIKKEHFFKKAELYKQGKDRYKDNGETIPLTADNYEIRTDDLNFVNSVADMKMQMISRWDKNSPFYE